MTVFWGFFLTDAGMSEELSQNVTDFTIAIKPRKTELFFVYVCPTVEQEPNTNGNLMAADAFRLYDTIKQLTILQHS